MVLGIHQRRITVSDNNWDDKPSDPLDDIMSFRNMINNPPKDIWYPATHQHIKTGDYWRAEGDGDGMYYMYFLGECKGSVTVFPITRINSDVLLNDFIELEHTDEDIRDEVEILAEKLKNEGRYKFDE